MKLRLVAFTLTALAAGALLGWLMQQDPGYVFISLANRTLETSVWFGLFSLLALWAAAALLVAGARWALTSRSRIATWRRGRRALHAERATAAGFIELLEGRWQNARQALEGAAASAGLPLLNYLAAARAAHELGDAAGRDALCEQALSNDPKAGAAVALARAGMLRDTGQWQECRAALDALLADAPRHPSALMLKLECSQRLGDWQGALDAATQLGKLKSADAAAVDTAIVEAWRQRFAAAHHDAAAARAAWNAMPRKLRRLPALTLGYAEALNAAGDGDGAEATLKAALKSRYDANLVECYGRVRGTQPAEQLATAERWLAEHRNDPVLTLALGRLSLAAGERDKAFAHLEASFDAAPTPDCCAELGRLHLSAGQLERGRALLEQALAGFATAQDGAAYPAHRIGGASA